MQNDLCTNCDGRGFHWLKGGIHSHHGGHIIADTYQQGPQCTMCRGTGRAATDIGCGTLFIFCVVMVVIFAFIINPLVGSIMR